MSFRIGRLARLSGFDPELLRMWERRYGLLEPERLENRFRAYTDDDVTVLARVRTLLDEGYSIGDIARIGRAKLLADGAASREAREAPTSTTAPITVSAGLEGPDPQIAWAALDALPHAVIVTDREGRVRWVNRGVPTLCGYDLADLYGLVPGRVLQGPDSEPEAVGRLRTAVTDRRPCSVRVVNYKKSGEPYLAQLDIAPIGVGKNHVGFVGTARLIDDAAASFTERAAASGGARNRSPSSPSPPRARGRLRSR